jgi:hypothetical protein
MPFEMMTVILSGRVPGREPRGPGEVSVHPRRESEEDPEEWEREEDRFQQGLRAAWRLFKKIEKE